MEFLNKVEIRGVVGTIHVDKVADTETAQISAMVEDAFRSSSGDAVIECTWFSVRVWKGKDIADFSRIDKGTKVHIIGRWRCRRYVASDGSDRTSYEVVAQSLEIVEE